MSTFLESITAHILWSDGFVSSNYIAYMLAFYWIRMLNHWGLLISTPTGYHGGFTTLISLFQAFKEKDQLWTKSKMVHLARDIFYACRMKRHISLKIFKVMTEDSGAEEDKVNPYSCRYYDRLFSLYPAGIWSCCLSIIILVYICRCLWTQWYLIPEVLNE